MGSAPGSPGANSITINSPKAENLRKRHVGSAADNFAADSSKSFGSSKAAYSDEEIEEIIQQLPDWKSQLSLRGYIVGECRGDRTALRDSSARLV